MISIHSLVKRETENLWRIQWHCPISIHSLVKRETERKRPKSHGNSISIHSLVKRETPQFEDYNSNGFDFNPLPRKEGDKTLQIDAFLRKYFNPLPRKEGDALFVISMCLRV